MRHTALTWHVLGVFTLSRVDDKTHQRVIEWLADWDIMMCLAPKKHISERLTDWLTDTASRVGNKTHKRATDWLAD